VLVYRSVLVHSSQLPKLHRLYGIKRIAVNYELSWIWEGIVVASLKLIYGGSEEDREMFKFIWPSVQEFNPRFARYKAWVPITGPRHWVLLFHYNILSTGRCPFGATVVRRVLACGLRHRTRSAWGSGGGPGGLQEAPYLADMISDASVGPQNRLSASPLAVVSGNITKWNVMDSCA
jgi:hypothetical protein